MALGDVLVFVLAVWVALFVRYVQNPELPFFIDHIIAFVPIIIAGTTIFFIAGLYEDELFILRNKLKYRLAGAVLGLAVCALVLFYTYPYAGVTPKSILVFFVIALYGLSYVHRQAWIKILSRQQKKEAVIIATDDTAQHIYTHINTHDHIPLHAVDLVPLETALLFLRRYTDMYPFSYIIIHTKRSLGEDVQEELYRFVTKGGKVIDEARLYETLFSKVALSDANYRSFFEPVSVSNKLFTAWKRMVDIAVSLFIAVLAVPLIVIAACVIKVYDGKEVFITQTRLGLFGKKIRLYKLRTMEKSDSGKWMQDRIKEGDFENRITPVGYFLRKTRIDELPQLWNVLRGDLSLIGPRPDIEGMVSTLEATIPYYQLRYAVKPGLSGWAQINQRIQPQSIEETKDRLAYDLYYVKHRSFFLDVYIGLKTIKTLIAREGR